eukprot:jgi/Chrzof1/6211/Cz17g15200.t1
MAAKVLFGVVAAVCLVVSASAAASAPPAQPAKKYATFNAGLKATANTNLIQQAISKLGITSYFNSPNLPLTVFAPTDQAFYALTSRLGVNPSILLSPALQKYLKPVVYYHMAKGVFKTTDLKVNKVLNTLNQDGKTLKVIGNSNGKVTIKSVGTTAKIVKPNIWCGKGVAHGIDNVLLPFDPKNMASFLG